MQIRPLWGFVAKPDRGCERRSHFVLRHFLELTNGFRKQQFESPPRNIQMFWERDSCLSIFWLTHLLKDIRLEWCHKSSKVLTRLEGWIIQWWLHFCGIILSIIIAAGFALACWRGESGALWGAISISQWYRVTMSTPKYSLNDGQIEGKALT